MELILNEHAFAQQAIACGTVGKKPAQTLGCISRYLCYEAMRSHRLRKRFTGLCGRTTRIITPCNGARQSSTFPPVRTDAPSYRPIRLKSPKRSLQASGRSQASLWNGFALHCYALQNMLNSLTRPTMAGSRRNGALFSAWPMCRRERRGRLPCCIPCGKKLIAFSRGVDNLHIHVLFFRPASQTACALDDLREPGLFYLSLQGERIIRCACCGKLLKPKTNNQKYCPDCRAEMNLKKTLARYHAATF